MFQFLSLAIVLNVFLIGQNLVIAQKAEDKPVSQINDGIDPQPITTPPTNGTSPAPTTTEVPPKTTTPTTTTTTTTTTAKPAPNVTTTTETPTTPTPTPPPTTLSPNVTTTTTKPTSSSSEHPPSSTTPKPEPTTPSPHPHTTEKPDHPSDRKFDAFSFLGGFSLGLGLVAIAFLSWKFYMSRQENVYHTL